jgi:hypothetical protein
MELVKCQICNASKAKHKQLLTEDEINQLLVDVYRGIINVRNLPKDIYKQIAKELILSAQTGYPFDNERAVLLEQNIYHFSAAKTYQMIRLTEQERQHKGKLIPFEKYKEAATGIVDVFLGTYLAAESSQCEFVGKAMKVFDKGNKTSQVWEYVTMKDGRVRPAHAYLDGLIFDVKNKEVQQFSPPNGWHCRCKKKYYKTGAATDLKDFDMAEAHQNIPPMFRRDFGAEGIAFPKDHPYFEVPRKDKDLPKKNFGLPDEN